MLTVLHVQSMLSIRGYDFIAPWAYEEIIYSKHWLSIRGKDFIAHWAYAEMFKSRISRSNQIRFSKISCYRPLGLCAWDQKDSVSAKKVFNKISCLCTFKKARENPGFFRKCRTFKNTSRLGNTEFFCNGALKEKGPIFLCAVLF